MVAVVVPVRYPRDGRESHPRTRAAHDNARRPGLAQARLHVRKTGPNSIINDFLQLVARYGSRQPEDVPAESNFLGLSELGGRDGSKVPENIRGGRGTSHDGPSLSRRIAVAAAVHKQTELCTLNPTVNCTCRFCISQYPEPKPWWSLFCFNHCWQRVRGPINPKVSLGPGAINPKPPQPPLNP